MLYHCLRFIIYIAIISILGTFFLSGSSYLVMCCVPRFCPCNTMLPNTFRMNRNKTKAFKYHVAHVPLTVSICCPSLVARFMLIIVLPDSIDFHPNDFDLDESVCNIIFDIVVGTFSMCHSLMSVRWNWKENEENESKLIRRLARNIVLVCMCTCCMSP